MLLADIPSKFNIPFANSAGGSFTRPIPQASQIGVQGGAASLTDGFPPLCFTPIASGGIPPFGEDFNGLLNQSTAWDRWFSAGGPVFYDGTFQSSAGGYPLGAIVRSNIVPDNFWQSTVDGNTTNPDTGGAGWVVAPATMGTGHWQWRPVAASLPSWVIMNGTTIGNASSGASQLASATAQFAFKYLWDNFSNTQCPVSGGRGATANADFAANKTIQVLDMRSTGQMGVDVMGNGAGGNGLLTSVPVVSGSATLPGSVLGENLHTLIIAETPVITPAGTITNGLISISQNANLQNGGASVSAGGNAGITTNAAATISASQAASTFTGTPHGSGNSHNTVQRSMLGYYYLKL